MKSRTGLVIGSLIFGLIIAEYILAPVLLTSRDYPSRLHLLLGYVAVPGRRWEDITINSQGYTGHVLSRSKPTPSTVRILTLGGSAMFNRRMTDRIITALSPLTSGDLEIQGGALPTHGTKSSLIKYRGHFDKYDFDFVLIYHGINDLWMNHVAPEDFEADYSHIEPDFKRNAVLEHSVIARIFYNRCLWSPAAEVEGGARFSSVRVFERNIRELVTLIRRDGGAPILMTFAWNLPEDYSLEKFWDGTLGYNNPDNYNPCRVETWGEPDYVREGLKRHNAAIRKIAKEERVLLVDQHENLSGDISNFGDVCHFSDEGTDFFVSKIAEFFQSEGLFSKPAAR